MTVCCWWEALEGLCPCYSAVIQQMTIQIDQTVFVEEVGICMIAANMKPFPQELACWCCWLTGPSCSIKLSIRTVRQIRLQFTLAQTHKCGSHWAEKTLLHRFMHIPDNCLYPQDSLRQKMTIINQNAAQPNTSNGNMLYVYIYCNEPLSLGTA